MQKYTIDIVKVLNGLPLELCATPCAKPANNRPTLAWLDRVRYTRQPSGEVVHGFITGTSATCATIYDQDTFRRVKVSRNRLTKIQDRG